MIVRILGEGQYDIAGDALQKLKEADAELFSAIAADDSQGFRSAFQGVLRLIRDRGTPVPLDRLVESDLIVPGPDTSLGEARKMYTDHPLV